MKHHLLANSIKSNSGNTEARNNIVRDDIEALSDVPLEALVTRRQLENNLPAPYSPPSPVGFIVNAGQPDTKTLDSTQLGIINTYARVPIITTLCSGVSYTDIWAVYTGNPGNYTAIVVHLHPDGSGNNADDTYVQFS